MGGVLISRKKALRNTCMALNAVGGGEGGGGGGGGGVSFPGKMCCKGVRFNVVSIMRGWVGVKFPGRSVT